MDMEKLRQGALALVLAGILGLAWLVIGTETQVGQYAAMGAMLGAIVGAWRLATGLMRSGD